MTLQAPEVWCAGVIDTAGGREDVESCPQGASERSDRRRTIVTVAAWAVMAIGAVVILDHLGRSRTFFYDEWNFVIDRWRLRADSLLAPHNGHLSVAPAAVYLFLFHTIGLDDYRVFRLVGLLVHVAVATGVVVYVRPRLGRLAAVGLGLVVLMLGTAWQDVMWPFQIGFMGSVLGLVGALLALDRRSDAGDVVAALMVGYALASSGVGIAVAVGIAAEVALTRPWRRWWIVAAPIAGYVVWQVLEGGSDTESSGLWAMVRFVEQSAAAAFAAIFGVGLGWGRLIMGIGLASLVVVLVRRRTVPPRTVAISLTLLAFWGLTALSRAAFGDPGASRYLYVGVVGIVLLVAELLPRRASRFIGPAILAVGVVSAVATWDVMRAGAGGLRVEGQLIGAELSVMEALRDEVPARLLGGS